MRYKTDLKSVHVTFELLTYFSWIGIIGNYYHYWIVFNSDHWFQKKFFKTNLAAIYLDWSNSFHYLVGCLVIISVKGPLTVVMGKHSVSLPIILIKNKVNQMLPSSYIHSLLVSILWYCIWFPISMYELRYFNNNNNNNSLYFQRVTHLAKKKLIFHEALYELPPKNNTSIKYKDDLHVYKIIQTSWNTFKPTYTQAYFFT